MFILWILTFLFTGLAKLVCTILGLILIPLATLLGAYGPAKSVDGQDIVLFTWTIMAPYNNLEDGILSPSFYITKSEKLNIIAWSAWRNPANGLRFMPFFAPKVEPQKVQYVASFNTDGRNIPLTVLYSLEEQGSFWYFVHQGRYAGFRWQFKLGPDLYRIWIGSKLFPTNTIKVWPYQRPGLGTTFQIRRVKRLTSV